MISTAYADNKLKVSGPLAHFAFEQTRIDLGAIRLDTFHTTLTTEYHLDPFGHLLVARVVEGTIDNSTFGAERRLGPGHVYLAAHHDKAQFTRLRGARVELTALDLPLIEATDPELGADRLARLHLRALPVAAAGRWQHAVSYLRRLASSPDADQLSPLVLGAAGRLVSAALLDAFAPDDDQEPSSARRDATPASLRLALAFIDANADLDIGVADIARASHIGVRALQLTFRVHLDTTPLAHLRRVRLNRAHTDLKDAEVGGNATVASIGARWGFSNSARFATQYRSIYGQSPGVTLRSP